MAEKKITYVEPTPEALAKWYADSDARRVKLIRETIIQDINVRFRYYLSGNIVPKNLTPMAQICIDYKLENYFDNNLGQTVYIWKDEKDKELKMIASIASQEFTSLEEYLSGKSVP